MATKRREAQMQKTREAILSSAMEIAGELGWSGVTIRRIAERIDYSAPIVYEYFANKEAMLTELQRQGFEALRQSLQDAADAHRDAPRKAALAVADAYIFFANEHSERYKLMHGLSSAALPAGHTAANARGVCEVVEAVLSRWANSKSVHIADMMQAVETCWALLHGLVSIALIGRFNGDAEQLRKLARKATSDLLTAWSTNSQKK